MLWTACPSSCTISTESPAAAMHRCLDHVQFVVERPLDWRERYGGPLHRRRILPTPPRLIPLQGAIAERLGLGTRAI